MVLRSLLRQKAHLRPCLCRCRHCRIFFLTHPRNARRRDLACPFDHGKPITDGILRAAAWSITAAEKGKLKNVGTTSDGAGGSHRFPPERVEPIAQPRKK